MLILGPSADPNKTSQTMIATAKEWPSWVTTNADNNMSHSWLKTNFLVLLPNFEKQFLLEKLDSLRIMQLTHWKCNKQWYHEFVQADVYDHGAQRTLIMYWERDMPDLSKSPKLERKRDLSIKMGGKCFAHDWVIFPSQADFDSMVESKKAYCLRYDG